MILFFKLITTPFFIGVITLLEKRWGAWIAGLLGGFPVIAGPIITFLALDNGIDFAIKASISGISGINCLLIFGISYCWLSKKFPWNITYPISVLIWFFSAFVFVKASIPLITGFLLTSLMLFFAPHLLPKSKIIEESINAPKIELAPRIIAGITLTLVITGLSNLIGPQWSGTLTMFPVIGSVLAIFIHRSKDANQVTKMYSGMARGLYSSAFYFLTIALMLPTTNIVVATISGLMACFAIQVVLNYKKILNKLLKI